MIFIDTNIVLNHLYETSLSDEAEKILRGEGLCTSGIVINELLFVIARTKASTKLGIKTIKGFRNYIAEHGYSFCEDEFTGLYDFLELLEIRIFNDHFDKNEFMGIATRCKLLPNDALIAATCKHYGITQIATFDADFKRVEFLEIITP
jgi:predicted nucleic acid-binding protein